MIFHQAGHTISYELVFREAFRGEVDWKTSAGILAAMTAILIRAETGDFTGLWEGMLMAHGKRLEMEVAADDRRLAREAGTEIRRRVDAPSAYPHAPSTARQVNPSPNARHLTQQRRLSRRISENFIRPQPALCHLSQPATCHGLRGHPSTLKPPEWPSWR